MILRLFVLTIILFSMPGSALAQTNVPLGSYDFESHISSCQSSQPQRPYVDESCSYLIESGVFQDDPENLAAAYWNRGMAAIEFGSRTSAEFADLNAAIELLPDNALGYLRRAKLNYRESNYDAVKRDMRQAASLGDPVAQEVLQHLDIERFANFKSKVGDLILPRRRPFDVTRFNMDAYKATDAEIEATLKTVDFAQCSGTNIDALETGLRRSGIELADFTVAVFRAEYVPTYTELEAAGAEMQECARLVLLKAFAAFYDPPDISWQVARKEWARRYGPIPDLFLWKLAQRAERISRDRVYDKDSVSPEDREVLRQYAHTTMPDYFSATVGPDHDIDWDAPFNLRADFYLRRYHYLKRELGEEAAKEQSNRELIDGI